MLLQAAAVTADHARLLAWLRADGSSLNQLCRLQALLEARNYSILLIQETEYVYMVLAASPPVSSKAHYRKMHNFLSAYRQQYLDRTNATGK